MDPTIDSPGDPDADTGAAANDSAGTPTGSYRTGSERYLHTGEIPEIDDLFAAAAKSAGVTYVDASAATDRATERAGDRTAPADAPASGGDAVLVLDREGGAGGDGGGDDGDDDGGRGGDGGHGGGDGDGGDGHEGAPRPGRIGRFRRRRPKTFVAIIVLLLLLTPISISYAKAVTKPGEESLTARTAEWARDMKLGFIVDKIEQWQFAKDEYATGGKPAEDAFKPVDSLAGTTTSTAAAAHGTTTAPWPHTPPPVRMASPIDPPADGEGVWTPAGPLIHGLPGVYTTKVRPNADHPQLTVFVSWSDPKLTTIKLYPGSELPGGQWNTPNFIPPDQCPKAIVASNGGFRLNDGSSRGGYYAEGRESEWKLRDGAASLVFYKDGHIDVAQWGREVTRNDLPQIESVRQNLELLVDNGQPTPATKGDGDWGAKLPNSYFVWRSGYGVTKDGALVYAGGPALKPIELAQTLINAGAVRAMEGDINPEWVHAFLYSVGPDGACHGAVVLPQSEDKGGMRAKPDRYLTTETRDFVVVSAKE